MVLKSYIQSNRLQNRVLITGRRTNIFQFNIQSIQKDIRYNDDILEEKAKEGTLFREDALVYYYQM